MMNDLSLNDRSLAILAYHKIGAPPPGGWESWYYIPAETFASHLSYLRDNGWEVIDVAAFLQGLTESKKLPDRAVLLTFDDGCCSIRDDALRCLHRFGYPAVLFVPTDYIGGRNDFDLGAEPEEAICDWGDLRALERQGVSIQSHTASHRAFSTLNPSEQAEELRRSKEILEAGLNNSVEIISYPFGDAGTNPAALDEALRRTGYRAACLYKGGPIRLPVSDPYRLTRVAMGPDTDLHAELIGRT